MLQSFQRSQMRALYLGLILSVIVAILLLLSVLLIYSLLIISVETRTFELGVHRMVGITRFGIIQMLLTQACTFSVPAWGLGLVTSSIVTHAVLDSLENSLHVPIDKHLSPSSILIASSLGLLAPLVASIFPIRAALSKNLHDALDTRQSKTKGVVFLIERAESNWFSGAWFVLGSGLSVFGFFVYYLLPMAFITYKIGLFFNIFFFLLIGMLLGLVLLSLNFEQLLERLLVFIFLWWEKRAISVLVLKNLVAHRTRNRKTTVMFAVSLSFILFITVAYNVEMRTSLEASLRDEGQKLVLSYGRWRSISYQQLLKLEHILHSHPSGIVEDTAWVTSSLSDWGGKYFDGVVMSTLGHIFYDDVRVRAVSPNYLSVCLKDLYKPRVVDNSRGGTITEQLYTVEGSQAAIIPSGFIART